MLGGTHDDVFERFIVRSDTCAKNHEFLLSLLNGRAAFTRVQNASIGLHAVSVIDSDSFGHIPQRRLSRVIKRNYISWCLLGNVRVGPSANSLDWFDSSWKPLDQGPLAGFEKYKSKSSITQWGIFARSPEFFWIARSDCPETFWPILSSWREPHGLLV